MESNFDGAFRAAITDIVCDLLGVKKPGDVLLAQVLPEAILREAQVCALANFSHATLRRRVAAGSFPPPVKLGDDRQGAASGWLASEVTAWMRSLRREAEEEPEPAGIIAFAPPPKPVFTRTPVKSPPPVNYADVMSREMEEQRQRESVAGGPAPANVRKRVTALK